MFKSALVPVAIAAVALAQFQDRPRPAPALNADPTDTNNPRLVGKTWPYADLPYKVDTLETARGIQVGFNQCNASTQNPTSMCQTLIANSIEDFCLFIPPTLMEVGNAEAGMVAACTKPTHGTRLIPAGAITGIRFMTTPSYVMMAGRINANLMNIPTGDGGGEVDSGGQDQRGNPIGGMVYSTALPFHKGTMSHGRVWHQFIGDDTFCFKACDPSAPDAMGLCEHVYDTVGCQINVPQDYAALQGVFEQCEGDDQKPVQPGVSDIPASSNCRTYASSALFSGLPTASGSTPTPTGVSSTGSASGSGTPRPSGTTSRSPTGSQTAGAGDGDDGALSVSWNALTLLVPVVAGLLGAAYVA